MKIVAWLEGIEDEAKLPLDKKFILCVHCSSRSEQLPASNDNVNQQLQKFLEMEILVTGDGIRSDPHKIRLGDHLSVDDEAEFQFEIQATRLGLIKWQMDLQAEGESIYTKKFSFQSVDFKPRFKQIKARSMKPEMT